MTSSSIDFVFLHGFLGVPEDWQYVQDYLRQNGNATFTTLNLWKEAGDDISMESLAQKISKYCNSNTVFIGYSLGGRVLLHLSQKCLDAAQGLVLISSHLGLVDDRERQVRVASDEQWSKSFLSEDWKSLMQRWNSQTVFTNDHARPDRLEANYRRSQLAQTLVKCSLGKQEFIGGNKHFPLNKTLFLYGLEDKKYCEYAKQWQRENSKMRVQWLVGGHYPLIQSAKDVSVAIGQFCRELEG